MSTQQEDAKLRATPQYAQWLRQGLVEDFRDEGQLHWRWTSAARAKHSTATLVGVANLLMGRPIWPVPDEASRMERLVKDTWVEDGFDRDGFLLIDE